MLTHLDLFSGIGGFALAAEWAGFTTIGFVEIDKYCQRVLKKHWSDVPVVEDIRDVEEIKEIVANAQSKGLQGYAEQQTQPARTPIGCRKGEEPVRDRKQPVTLITGGFPCQPFSVAGRRRGTEDNRYLWGEMLTIVKVIKPTWVLAENVAGIAGMEFTDSVPDLEGEAPEEVEAELSAVLDRVCSDLEKSGYEVQPIVIPACAINAPHRRDRVWIVAWHSEGDRSDKVGGVWQGEKPIAGGVCGDVPNTTEQRLYNQKDKSKLEGAGSFELLSVESRDTEDVALTESGQPREQTQPEGRENTSRGGEEVAIAQSEGDRIQGRQPIGYEASSRDWWATEPELGGRPHGFPLWLYRHCGRGLSYEESIRRAEVLRDLWREDVSKALWCATRGYDRMEQAEILFAFVCQYENDSDKARLLLESEKALVEFVFSLWEQGKLTSPPPRPADRKQWEREHPDLVQTLPRLLAYTGKQDWQISNWEDAIPRVAIGVKNRVDRLKCLGNAIVPPVAYQILKVIAELETNNADL